MLVEEVVLGHLRYLESVQRFLEGGPRPALSSPEDCLLGRWIGGEGKDKYGQTPWFGELVERHKAFHNLTEEAVRLQERGESEEAAKRMNEAYGLFARIEHILLEMPA
jgi:methyl-accepting chemotaxis protein